MFFPFVKTSGYHLKVYVLKLNQIHMCQTTIVEKHLCQYNIKMNSMSKSKSWTMLQEDKKNDKESILKSIIW